MCTLDTSHALHARRPLSSCQADTEPPQANLESLLADLEPSLTDPLPTQRDPEPPQIDSLPDHQASQATNIRVSHTRENKLRALAFHTYCHVTVPFNNRFLVCSYSNLGAHCF